MHASRNFRSSTARVACPHVALACVLSLFLSGCGLFSRGVIDITLGEGGRATIEDIGTVEGPFTYHRDNTTKEPGAK